MNYDEFLDSVQERARLSDRTEAERTSVAVLQALCDRLTSDETHDLLAQLPYQLKTAVIVSRSPQPISAGEFVDLVAREVDLSPDEARNRIRAVFATLREAVSWGEFQDVLEELDPDYADLLA